MIKVAEGLYHKVDNKVNPSDLYEHIYQKVLKGDIEIPSKFITVPDYKSLDNKEAFLKNIEEFINAREIGLNIESRELVSLYQVAFDHTKVEGVNISKKVKDLAAIKGDINYLKGDFVSDFYHYILTEKNKNSQIYRDVLQHFSITDRDITLDKTIPNIEGISFKQALEDYIRLKGDTSMEYLLPTNTNTDIELQEKLQAINFPESIKGIEKLPSKAIKDGDMYITSNLTKDIFIRDGKQVYRRAMEDSKNVVFAPIKTNGEVSVYYNTNTAATYSGKTARALLKKYVSRQIERVVNPNTKEALEKSGLSSEIISEMGKLRVDTLGALKTILNRSSLEIKDNYIRITNTDRLKPYQQARILKDAATKGNTVLKEKLGKYYVGTPLTYDPVARALKLNLNPDAIAKTLELDAKEISAMKEVLAEVEANKFNYFEGQVISELQRGVEAEFMKELGINVSEKAKNAVAAITDSKIEFVSLPNVTEELSSYNKVGDCG
jgi:hypothetical protein